MAHANEKSYIKIFKAQRYYVIVKLAHGEQPASIGTGNARDYLEANVRLRS